MPPANIWSTWLLLSLMVVLPVISLVFAVYTTGFLRAFSIGTLPSLFVLQQAGLTQLLIWSEDFQVGGEVDFVTPWNLPVPCWAAWGSAFVGGLAAMVVYRLMPKYAPSNR